MRIYKTETYIPCKPEEADRAMLNGVECKNDKSGVEPMWDTPLAYNCLSTEGLIAFGATFEKLIKAPEGFYIGDPVEDAGYRGEYRFHNGDATIAGTGRPMWDPVYIYFLPLPQPIEPSLPPYDETKYRLATEVDRKGRKPIGVRYVCRGDSMWQTSEDVGGRKWKETFHYLIPIQQEPIPCAGYLVECDGRLGIVQENGFFQPEVKP